MQKVVVGRRGDTDHFGFEPTMQQVMVERGGEGRGVQVIGCNLPCNR